MPRFDLTVTTHDGICPISVITPTGAVGPWPAVILFMDMFGIRPAMREMGQRLADGGYLVLLPDLYYRQGSYAPKIPSQVYKDPRSMKNLAKWVCSLDRGRNISDIAAFLGFLFTRPEVAGDRFGITGYGMGGTIALTAAGAFPDRFAAVASFHAGNLATGHPDSPHLFARNITGSVYIASNIEDSEFSEEQKTRLAQALAKARVNHLIETYPGGRHGCRVPDVPTFDPTAAERHWAILFRLFRETLAEEH